MDCMNVSKLILFCRALVVSTDMRSESRGHRDLSLQWWIVTFGCVSLWNISTLKSPIMDMQFPLGLRCLWHKIEGKISSGLPQGEWTKMRYSAILCLCCAAMTFSADVMDRATVRPCHSTCVTCVMKLSRINTARARDPTPGHHLSICTPAIGGKSTIFAG